MNAKNAFWNLSNPSNLEFVILYLLTGFLFIHPIFIGRQCIFTKYVVGYQKDRGASMAFSPPPIISKMYLKPYKIAAVLDF